jgi:hypothetical protein
MTPLPSAEYLAEVRASVVASRARQGLPPTITDPAILERVAAIFRLVPQPDQPRSAPVEDEPVEEK